MSTSILNQIPDDVPGLWENLRARLNAKNKRKPRVVIHGGYGKRNMGDDALFHAIYTRVRENLHDAHITAVCHGPERIKAWYPDISTCHFKSLGAVRCMLKSDVYIVGGGGIINKINTYSGNMVFRLLDMKGKFMFLAAIVAKLSGAAAVFYGIGAESFPDAGVRFLARVALNHVASVSVRDPLSLTNLKKAGVHRNIVQVLDPALSLSPDQPESIYPLLERLGLQPKGRRPRPLVGLNLRYVGDPAVSNERSLHEAARLVTHLVEEMGVDVLFLSISQHTSKPLEDDLDFGLRLHERLPETVATGYRVLTEYPRPREFMTLLGQMDAMILSRLHAVILGTKQGVPILTVTYDDKVTQFVRLSGQEDMLVDLVSFTLETMHPMLIGLLRR